MRLTARLSLFVGLGMLVVFAAHAALRVQRDLLRYERDITSDHRVLARAVATAIDEIAAVEGVARARALLERLNENEAHVQLRWVDVDRDHPIADAPIAPVRARGRDPRTQRVPAAEQGGVDALVTHQLLRGRGLGATAIEVLEPLRDEDEYTREAVARTATTTAVALALCIAIIIAFGRWFVGRPLGTLRDHARRVAGGDLAVRTTLVSRDEIGDLAHAMNEMTRELEQARVRVREEELARADTLAQLRHVDRLRVVGEIASAVAHDLGTPMSTVRARAQMIGGGEIDGPRARELAGAIVAEVDRMSAAIQRLLGHARRGASAKESVDLRAWSQTVIELVRPLAERRRILLLHDQEGDARARIDPVELRQAITNVLVNALDASRAGDAVELRVRAVEGSVRIEVIDRGEGMPPEVAARALDPFFTTKREGAGTGLGLAIARGIVEEHGGTIAIESAPALGTSVVIEVPA